MRYRVYTFVLLVAVLGLSATAFLHLPLMWTTAASVTACVALGLLWRSVSKPLNALSNGASLLREQDFGSRLRKCGQPDADRIVALFNDMMATLKAERLANMEQENFLTQVVQASPMGIAVCDLDGNISEANPAWRAMASEDLMEAARSLADGESRTLRLSSSRIVRVSRQWFMDRGFRRRFYLAEPLTAEIIGAQKQIFNKIVRTIGHEVNNTLGSVISVLETLADIHSGEPAVHEAINAGARSCDNLVKFVRGYADIAKLPRPEPVETELNAYIASLIPVLSGLAPGNVKIEFRPDPQPQFRPLDTMLIERVMINVVKNAVESIGDRPDGLVTVAVNGHTVTITDNGRGIAPEDAARLFTPFFSTKRPDRGLGLMLVTDILHAHDAAFTLTTSSGLTAFSFSL